MDLRYSCPRSRLDGYRTDVCHVGDPTADHRNPSSSHETEYVRGRGTDGLHHHGHCGARLFSFYRAPGSVPGRAAQSRGCHHLRYRRRRGDISLAVRFLVLRAVCGRGRLGG